MVLAIVWCDTLAPYVAVRCRGISRVVMPLGQMLTLMSSKCTSRRVPLETSPDRMCHYGALGTSRFTGPAKGGGNTGLPTSEDLVECRFARSRLNGLWMSDITEHSNREGKIYGCCVMDICSHRIVRWSIDTVRDS